MRVWRKPDPLSYKAIIRMDMRSREHPKVLAVGKRQTIRLPIIKRRFISGVVSCIHLEALRTRASDHPVLRDLYFHFHHCASAVL